MHFCFFLERSGAPFLSEVFFRPRSRSKTQTVMFLGGEASYRLENRILGNDFGRRSCLYPLLLGPIFKKTVLQKKCASAIFFWRRFFFGVEKSKVANRLKRVFPKFETDRSEVRGVNASSKYISLKYPPPGPRNIFIGKYVYQKVFAGF